MPASSETHPPDRNGTTGPADRLPGARSDYVPRPLLPVTLVVFSLLALAVLAVIVDRHLAVLGDEIVRVSNPARTAVRSIQVSLALETAGTRGYLLTGDSAFVVSHQRARANRQEATARLLVIASGAETEVRELAARLSEQLQPADAALDSLVTGQLSREEFATRLPVQQERLEAISETLSQLGMEVSQGTARHVAHVRAVQQRSLVVTVLLVILTLAAAGQVTRLGLSYRALAARAQSASEESDAARREAERRRSEAEELYESRARLVRGFTHDVKNPIGAAAGYLDLIEHGAIDPMAGVKNARRTLKAALSLIQELLLLARADTGEIAIRRAPLDLRAVTRAAVEDARPLASAKGLSLSLEAPAVLPAVDSDAERIRQVLDNLISNAVKYTKAGAVTVRVLRCTDSRGPGPEPYARVDVCDTGPGMGPDEQERVFQEFERLDAPAGVDGTGLGLTISRRIANALGGDVVVTSEVGAGSTFSLLLPGTWVDAALVSPSSAVGAGRSG